MTAELKDRHAQFMMLLTSRSWSSVPRSQEGGGGGGTSIQGGPGVYSFVTFKVTSKQVT